MKITYLFVHHAGGFANDPYAKTQGLTEKQIDSTHKQNWPDFISTLGFYIGYNIIIWADGSWKQYREIGAETAAQTGYNHNSVSICLAGNFTKLGNGHVEAPTFAKEKTLKSLEMAILFRQGSVWDSLKKVDGVEVDVRVHNILPHRAVAVRDCYGTLLSDSWARDLVVSVIRERLTILTRLLIMYQNLLMIYQKMKLGVRVGRSAPHACWSSNERG